MSTGHRYRYANLARSSTANEASENVVTFHNVDCYSNFHLKHRAICSTAGASCRPSLTAGLNFKRLQLFPANDCGKKTAFAANGSSLLVELQSKLEQIMPFSHSFFQLSLSSVAQCWITAAPIEFKLELFQIADYRLHFPLLFKEFAFQFAFQRALRPL